MTGTVFVLLALCGVVLSREADYTGHKVLSVSPASKNQLAFLYQLRKDYMVDFWNEPKELGVHVMMQIRPSFIEEVEDLLQSRGIHYDIAFEDLQSVISSEKAQYSNRYLDESSDAVQSFDFGRYNRYEDIVKLLTDLATDYPDIAKLETVGKSFENRPIYALKIGAGESKPAIMMECGIHAREWSSVAAGTYLVHRLITTYSTDPVVKGLVDKYEFNVVVEANPDGYIFTWNGDRMWRKTRSRSQLDWMGVCRGADANRNFDIEHCGVGTSRKPCDDTYCGDRPFSESESRALRDMMVSLESRLKLYISIHAFSQLWMTPYGITKRLPANYKDLIRVGNIGATALSQKYGTKYKVGAIANVIYEAAGSSVDYAYVKHNVKMAFALELRDTGRFGFFLPQAQIEPMCEETYDGLIATIQAV